jgi:DNA-damage-inducible protein J
MSNISNVSFRIDTDLKNQADTLFQSLGLNMTTAFNMFLRQSVREGRIPFEATINVPNSDTIAAMLESMKLANDPNVKAYDVEDALKELKR